MSSSRNNQVRKDHANLVSAAFERLLQALSRLLADVSKGVAESTHYETVSESLDSVPLTTEEHALATQRLKNVSWYAAQGEHGAAHYELSMLSRSFAARQQASGE
jgi:hypothetical protein